MSTKQPKVEQKPRDLESDSDFESPNLLARKLVPRRPKEVKMKKVGLPPFSLLALSQLSFLYFNFLSNKPDAQAAGAEPSR